MVLKVELQSFVDPSFTYRYFAFVRYFRLSGDFLRSKLDNPRSKAK